MVNYSGATWRILIHKSTYIEITVCGCLSERDAVEPSEVKGAAMVLKELGIAIERIRDRWSKIQ